MEHAVERPSLESARALVSKGLASNQSVHQVRQARHMIALYQEGRLRVQPASYYSKARSHWRPSATMNSPCKSTSPFRATASSKVVKNPPGNVPPDMSSPTSSTFAFSSTVTFGSIASHLLYRGRFIRRFAATACVIIKDRQEFTPAVCAPQVRRLFQAPEIVKVLPSISTRSVPPRQDSSTRCRRTSGNAYQDEYQVFVWETPDRRPLSHVDLAGSSWSADEKGFLGRSGS